MKYNYNLLLILILVSSLSTKIYTQNENIDVVFWSKERNLTWDDFKSTPLVDSIDNFYFDLYIQSTNVSEVENFILFGNQPETYMFSNTSYIDPDIKSEDLLRYLNAYWDLAGYYSYKLTKTIAEARNSENITIKSNPEIISNSVLEEWRIESTRLSIDTDYGRIIEKMLDWEEDIAQKVATIKKPRLDVSKYAFGFDLQGGGLIPFGNYSDFLTKTGVGVLSMELTKAPFIFATGFAGGGQEVKMSFPDSDGNLFVKDTNPNIFNLFFHLGYLAFHNNHVRIIPRVGLHSSRLTYPKDSGYDATQWNFNFTTGCTVDYKLFGWSARAYSDHKLTDVSLRLGAYLFPMSIGESNISHGIISAGLSFTIGGGNLKYD